MSNFNQAGGYGMDNRWPNGTRRSYTMIKEEDVDTKNPKEVQQDAY